MSRVATPPLPARRACARRANRRENEGLGTEQQGRLEPVPTLFKRDTVGLGARGPAGKPRLRVTHFQAHSELQASRARDGLSDAQRKHLRLRPPKVEKQITRKQMRRMRQEEAAREKRLRQEICGRRNRDIPEELMALLG